MLLRMQGVTTAIVAFLFVCMAFPSIVRNRPQYYAAMVLVLLIILLDAIGHMSINQIIRVDATNGRVLSDQISSFRIFLYVTAGFFQVASILLLFLSAGGLTPRQLAAELKGAYEVIRRGEQEKTVVIPINKKRPDAAGGSDAPQSDQGGHPVYVIDSSAPGSPASPSAPGSPSAPPQPPANPAPARKSDTGAIPLE